MADRNKKGGDYTAVDKYAVAIEELDFIAVNCGEEEEDPFWLAQLREDVTNMHRHHHLIKATWLEKKPDGTENAYVPGTDDNVLAGSIICRVKLKDITEKGPQMNLGLSQKQKDRILRKLAEQTAALESSSKKATPDMTMMLDSDNETRKANLDDDDDEDDELFDEVEDDSDRDIFYDDDQEWRASTTGRVLSHNPRKKRKRAPKEKKAAAGGSGGSGGSDGSAVEAAQGLLAQNVAIATTAAPAVAAGEVTQNI